jgi:hypothetical protein
MHKISTTFKFVENRKYVIGMGQFPIEKCQVIWRKDVSSDNDRKEIIKNLKGMALELQEAIDFTIRLSNRKMNEIKYWLETSSNTDSNYTLSIYYDSHALAWGMLIEMMDNEKMHSQVVGEIACKDPVNFHFIEEIDILKTEPLF